MFESAELGHTIDKKRYQKEVPKLRAELLEAQYQVLEAGKFPVVIVVAGVPGAGRGRTVNLLNEWMDPRHIHTHSFGPPSDEEQERPAFWRFWRALPPKGKTAIFFGSWYTDPIVSRAQKRTTDADLEHSMEEVVRFERMLADEGALVVKFWFHLSKKQQKKRLETLEGSKRTRWRVTKDDWKRYKLYDLYTRISENALRETSTAPAPWIIVEGMDDRYRNLTVGKALLGAMKRHLSNLGARPVTAQAAPTPLSIDAKDVLTSLDQTQALSKDKYERELEDLSERLNRTVRRPKFQQGKSAVLVFEGMDAAGKGGAIRRITAALDARSYQVVPIAAPTDEERAQPYLWRFWRHIPRHGHITVFDRSYYGRVLVERVEGFCKEADWMRAFGEINDFEEQLVRHGILVVKFWLQITAQEQLRRFKERSQISFKRFKITDEDWRNRKKWPDYERAVCEMVDRTSTEIAPWTLVEANDKNWARIKVMRTVADRLDEWLE